MILIVYLFAWSSSIKSVDMTHSFEDQLYDLNAINKYMWYFINCSYTHLLFIEWMVHIFLSLIIILN